MTYDPFDSIQQYWTLKRYLFPMQNEKAGLFLFNLGTE